MFEQLSKGLFAIYSPNEGANCYLLLGKQIALIDSSIKGNSDYLKNSLDGIGLKPADINIVLHTHGHADHFGASGLFKKASYWMHEFDAKYVNFKDRIFTQSARLNNDFFPKISSFYKESQLFRFNPFNLEAIFTPGHTSGSVCFLERDKKLIFSGDTLFHDAVGRCDLPSGNRYDLVSSLKKIHALDFNILLPGHGSISKGKQKQNIKNAMEYFI